MFGQRLAEIRKARGLNRSELGRLAALSPNAISQLEAGKRTPLFATVEALAKALQCATDDFSARPGSPVPPPRPKAPEPAGAALGSLVAALA